MAIKEGKNLNDSFFTLEGMEEFKDTFKNTPLLCAFPKKFMEDGYKIGDAHNSKIAYDKETDTEYYSYLDPTSERCVGFTPGDSDIQIEMINGERWLTLNSLVWTQYNFELVKDILKKKRTNGKTRVSVEIEVEDYTEKDGLDYLNKWRGLGITLLNDNVQEAIQGANLVAYSESTQYEKYKLAMSFAYDKQEEPTKDKATYNKVELTKEETQLIKEKYSQEGYSCFASDEKFAYLFKAGKIFSHPLFAANADEVEEKEEMAFAEAEVKEMSLMAKVGTEDDGEVVKMAVDEMVANYVEEVGKKFADDSEAEKAEMALKLSEAEAKFAEAEAKFEADKAEMATQIDGLTCHAKEVEAAKEEMAKKLEEYADAEKEKFEAEANEVFADSKDLDDDEKAEMAKKVKDGTFTSVKDVKKEFAYLLFEKAEASKSGKKDFSFNIVKDVKVEKDNTTKSAIDTAFEAVKK